MNIDQKIEMIMRGESEKEYKSRIKRLQKYSEERDYLQDAIEILKGDPRQSQKKKRLDKVNKIIDRLK